jgi:hypothetical protein
MYMCTRFDAVRRLMSRWITEVDRDPSFADRLPLTFILTEENIAAVSALNLYPDYDDFADRQRGREMITAWMALDKMSPTQ